MSKHTWLGELQGPIWFQLGPQPQVRLYTEVTLIVNSAFNCATWLKIFVYDMFSSGLVLRTNQKEVNPVTTELTLKKVSFYFMD